jgi:hypothetical protein
LADIHRDSINAIHDILTPDQAREFEKLHSQAHGYTAHLPYDEEISTSTTPTKRTS